MIYLIILGSTLLQFADSWWPNWAFTVTAIPIYFAYSLRKNYCAWSLLSISLIIVNSFFVTIWRKNQYENVTGFDKLNISYTVFYSLICVILFSAFFIHNKNKKLIKNLFGLLCYLDGIYVILQFLIGTPANMRSGFLNYPGMNACFIAMTMPFVLDLDLKKELKYFLFGLSGLAVLLSNSSIPLGVLSVVFAALFWKFLNSDSTSKKYLKNFQYCFGITIVIFPIIIGYFLFQDKLFDDTGRFEIIHKSLEFTKVSPFFNLWTGTGNGSFMAFGPGIITNYNKYNLITWMHSDIFQTYFELGLVSFIVFIAILKSIARLYRSDYTMFMSGIAWISCATLNFPIHMAPTAMLGAFLFWEGSWKRQSPRC